MSLKNVVIGIAIIILTVSVAVYGVNLVYNQPEYNDFCSDARFPKAVDGNDTVCPTVCVEMYEISPTGECVFNECGSGCGPDGVNSFDTLAQCEIVASGGNCWEAYDDAYESYSRNLFLITLPLGIIIIALGALVFGLEAVGAGLMGGGVGVLLWGVFSFWRFADDWLKFILSLVGLAVVIWLAYYFNKRLEQGKRGNRKKKG